MIISSTISPTLTKPGLYFLLYPKETLSKRVKRILCKVLYSQFFPQVRKQHCLSLKVYVHILEWSLILLKKKSAVSPSLYNIQKKKKTPPNSVHWVLNELLAFTWHSVVLTGKAKYHSYIMIYGISSQDIFFPISN